MKILLLEDDIALNRAIKKVTQLDGHITTTFTNGEDVLTTLDNKFDLYILDINVPNISGLDLLHLIHNQDNNSRIIIMSSNIDISSIQKAYQYGCLDYLKKPFHLEELRLKIDKLDNNNSDLLSSITLKSDGTTLTKNEKVFLTLLLSNKNTTVTYNMIENSLYIDKEMSMDSLRALVKRLRSKLQEDIIQNVLEEGYKIST